MYVLPRTSIIFCIFWGEYLLNRRPFADNFKPPAVANAGGVIQQEASSNEYHMQLTSEVRALLSPCPGVGLVDKFFGMSVSRLVNSIRLLRQPRSPRRTWNVLFSMTQSPRQVLLSAVALHVAAGISSRVTFVASKSHNRPSSHPAPRHRTSRSPPHCHPPARLFRRDAAFDVHRPHSIIC